MSFDPGSLVHARGKDWVVLPSKDPDLLLIKPLEGTEEETAGIFLPLGMDRDIRPTVFTSPRPEDLGDIASTRLLYNALRLSFRSGAGPFRSLGRLSFRPRGYQLVPLIMALRQAEDPLRLMIADDVGVGKTIEALLILRELLDRRVVERFAVICPPHLCEQWRYELASKFGIEAVVIRSSTQAALDRGVRGDASVFRFYPFQVISVDYIKSEAHRRQFVSECPELVIADEAHTCARPLGASETQQQRYRLLREIADRHDQGLILLTATPHSGKTEEFQSLLGLLDRRYEVWDLMAAGERERRELAEHYVQRRRKDVEVWQGRHSSERTIFPHRDSKEIAYSLSAPYLAFYQRLHAVVRGLVRAAAQDQAVFRIRYWSALTLLRGSMSSPDCGVEMLTSRSGATTGAGSGPEGRGLPEDVGPVQSDSERATYDQTGLSAVDSAQNAFVAAAGWGRSELVALTSLAKELATLSNLENDVKAREALRVLAEWLSQGFQPVVFCRFIATANYLGRLLKPELERGFPGIEVEVVTSEDPDEVRKSRVEAMGDSPQRVLIATDCLSEGINLQELFTAVLHYDLPWNPNRLEQREGRVDRFGQKANEVKAFLLYGTDNPMDGVVLNVLLKKVRQIRKSIGISIPFPEDSLSLMDAVMKAVLLSDPTTTREQPRQLELDLETAGAAVDRATSEVEAAARREEQTRSIFAQHSIHPEEIEADLAAMDLALGKPADVEAFTLEVTRRVLRTPARELKGDRCYALNAANLPAGLREDLLRGAPATPGRASRQRSEVKVSFESPVPEGFLHVGRAHPFVQSICRQVLLRGTQAAATLGLGRASVVRTRDVSVKTVLLLFRARHVIQDVRTTTRMVAEEAVLAGYEGPARDARMLPLERAKLLAETVSVSSDLSSEGRQDLLTAELTDVETLAPEWVRLAEARASEVADMHERFRRSLERRRFVAPRYSAVLPPVPMDLIAILVLLPETSK